MMGWNSSVGIATRYRLDGPGLNPVGAGGLVCRLHPAYQTVIHTEKQVPSVT